MRRISGTCPTNKRIKKRSGLSSGAFLFRRLPQCGTTFAASKSRLRRGGGDVRLAHKTGPLREPNDSGSRGERKSSGTDESCRLRRGEGCEACSDAEPPISLCLAKRNGPFTVQRENAFNANMTPACQFASYGSCLNRCFRGRQTPTSFAENHLLASLLPRGCQPGRSQRDVTERP